MPATVTTTTLTMNSMPMGSDPPVLPALDNTLGAMLLGTFAGLM